MSAARARALRSLIDPIVSSADCDLEDVVVRQAGKRRLVRVVVDHDGGLSLDLVAALSRELSRALDDADVLGEAPYVLEVTSPGVDRPLTQARHWRRAVGRLVLVTPRSGESFEGRVIDAGPEAATLDVDGHPRAVAYPDVARAVVQVEFRHLAEADLEGPDEDDEPGEG
jgi:ribosome maturation factor RimP